MKKPLPFLFAAFFPLVVQAASVGKEGFDNIRQCVMQNDSTLCNKTTTDNSHDILQRFMSYKLMPCLPTNFSYVSESQEGAYSIVRSSMPAGGGKTHYFRMAFTGEPGNVKADIPESLRIGLGEKWENKIQMAEQIFLMLQANAGGSIKCDQLTGLVKK